MEQKKIEEIIEQKTKYLPGMEGPVIPYYGDAAAEITKMCSADKYDALECMNVTWHDIEDGHIAQIAGLREALEWLMNLHHDVSKAGQDPETGAYCPVTDEEWKAALAEAKKALADAPKTGGQK